MQLNSYAYINYDRQNKSKRLIGRDNTLLRVYDSILFTWQNSTFQHQGRKVSCPTLKRLSELTGLSIRTIQRAIKKLVAIGVITSFVKRLFNGTVRLFFEIVIEKLDTLSEVNKTEKTPLNPSKHDGHDILSPSDTTECRVHICKEEITKEENNNNEAMGTTEMNRVGDDQQSVQNGTPQDAYTQENMALVTPSNISFRPFRYQSTDKIDHVKVLVKLPSSKTWDAFSLPTSIPQSEALQIYASPQVKLSGGCDVKTGKCSYNVFAQTHINAMPWGKPQSPQCEGFTPEQLLLINFNKIDLSEYINSLGREMSDQQRQQLADQAREQMGDFAGSLNTGGNENNQPSNEQGQKVVTVTPLTGQGTDNDDFKVELRANVNFPSYIPFNQCGYPADDHNNNLIRAIDIDWGDGTRSPLTWDDIKNTSLSGSDYGGTGACTYHIPLYIIDHVYHTPDGKTQLVPIKVTLHTQNGDHETVINVENEWDKTDHNNQTGGGFSDAGTSYKVNQYSDGASFDAGSVPGTENGR